MLMAMLLEHEKAISRLEEYLQNQDPPGHSEPRGAE
jgi:hypothetical protein